MKAVENQPEETPPNPTAAPDVRRPNTVAGQTTDTELFRLNILLELERAALTAIVTGQESRGLLCEGVSTLFDASGVAHASVDLTMNHSELYLFRGDPTQTESHVLFSIEERGLDLVPETSRWYTCAARRSIFEWIDRPFLAELPLIIAVERLCVVVIGRPLPFDPADEQRLAQLGRQLAAIERVRQRIPVYDGPVQRETFHLTGREVEVLLLLRQGLLARGIAARLGVSDRTVHKHLGSIYAKLGVHDRMLAVKRAEGLGLTDAQTEPRSDTA
jgi:DNA-binding CsgD family transcriptional regulator